MDFLVVYRPHNKLNVETRYYGPFMSYRRAWNFLSELPALGVDNTTHYGNPGVKYITDLTVTENDLADHEIAKAYKELER